MFIPSLNKSLQKKSEVKCTIQIKSSNFKKNILKNKKIIL